jgi:assimilatory nitrate reductase catalytic subunit
MADRVVKTTCPYCGVGCGIRASREDGRVRIAGDDAHPANRGRLCSKGTALAETLDLRGRLLHPEIGGQRVSWDAALAATAAGLARIVEEHGPDAVAFYCSGQMLTEDYYVANKLMKGFIGSGNIDTNSRLCMASAVVGHKRAFGADAVPVCYADLEAASLVVLVGSNLAWCHPILYQRLKQARQTCGTRVVVIDPRRTAACEIADQHLPLRPGSDVWLFNGLLRYLGCADLLQPEFIEACTEGAGEALAAAAEATVERVAVECDLEEREVRDFYSAFAHNERVVTAFSQGVNQSSAGSDKVNSIINCHLVTGRIGRPGMGPFSITGQPNAMGGREVGGLATQLAAHMDFTPDAIDRVGRFWDAKRMARRPGLKAVELFDAVHAGTVKAVWIMATNPAVSLPDAERVRAALDRCELVVVSDCMAETDTMARAHVRLPALAWGEKNGTVTNSERRISRQRPFLPPPGEAKPDWWIVCEVARRMGFGAAFPYRSPHQIFLEHARLSGFENDSRVFNIAGLSRLDSAEYDALVPIQWPVPTVDHPGTPRLFEDGRFATGSGKARLVAVSPTPPVNAVSPDFPLVLNTGRVRDHWHTLTRTGKSARLGGHVAEPFVALHPADAAAQHLAAGALCEITSRWGSALVRVRIDPGQRRGSVFAPMHWSDTHTRHGYIDAVVNPAVDPLSGEPEFKHTPVRLSTVPTAWYGFILSRTPLRLPELAYWSRTTVAGGERYEIVGARTPESWSQWTRECLPGEDEWLEFSDNARGSYRAACFRGGRLESCLFVAANPVLPAREPLLERLGEVLDSTERQALLAAACASGAGTVCACFRVGEAAINAAIAGGARTPAAVTHALKAGGNCGSCLPEIGALIAKHAELVA